MSLNSGDQAMGKRKRTSRMQGNKTFLSYTLSFNLDSTEARTIQKNIPD